MHAGVVIAGGRSTRFGEADKAVAELAGTPLIRRVVDRLSEVVETLVVNCQCDQVAAIETALEGMALPVRYALDPEPDLGPLAGIAAGLGATEAEYAAVVACDMPFVAPGLLELLFEQAAGHDAAVPRLDDEWLQTTQAVYRAGAMAAACERAIDRGDRRIVAAFDDLDVVIVEGEALAPYAEAGSFDNLNTPAEFEAAAERIRQQTGPDSRLDDGD